MFITKVQRSRLGWMVPEWKYENKNRQVPLVFGIAHGYSLTSFALDLYPSEQFNSEQMCWNIGHF